MRARLVAASILLLSSCGREAPAPDGGNATVAVPAGVTASSNAAESANASAAPANEAAANETASATADGEAEVRAAVDRIYAEYEGKKGSDQTLSPDFQAAWNHAIGDDGALDYDPFCDCQDYDAATFRHRIKSVTLEGDHARAVVELKNFGETRSKTIDLVRIAGRWRIDDLPGDDGASLKRTMRQAERGSMALGV